VITPAPPSTWHPRMMRSSHVYRCCQAACALQPPQDGQKELSFEFRKQRFCWEADEGAFEKLKYPTHVRFRHLPPAFPQLSRPFTM